MLASLAKAVAQLSDTRFRRVLTLGLISTIVLYVLLYLGVGWGLSRLALFHIGWADRLTDILGGIAVFVLTLVMFPGVVTLVLSFLLDDVAAAVEARHYPGLPLPRKQGFGELTWGAVRFTLVTVAVNLVALPVYLVLLFVGVGIGLYYLVNGYLLAREYFELVAWRRMDPRAADALRRTHLVRLWLSGLAIAFLSTVPVVNLVAPLVGTAAMVHEVEALRRRA
jgi:CysZ protein